MRHVLSCSVLIPMPLPTTCRCSLPLLLAVRAGLACDIAIIPRLIVHWMPIVHRMLPSTSDGFSDIGRWPRGWRVLVKHRALRAELVVVVVVCVCVCARARACVRVCVCGRVAGSVCVHARGRIAKRND